MKKVRENILILADLSSPLMKPRIMMLKDLPYNKYILHNANNIRLDEATLSDYTGFNVLQHPRIISLRMRYLYSFFYILFLLLRLKPKLIVVHWASRLYQNLLLALWGKRVIVHTMGGDINKEEDCYGKKKFFTGILLKNARIITGKTYVMKEISMSSFPFLNQDKIKILSWGVEDRFFEKLDSSQKKSEKMRLLGKNYQNVFFSIRTFKRIHFQKEIIKAFLENYKNDNDTCLIVSLLAQEKKYYDECDREINFNENSNIIFVEINHKDMHKYLQISNVIISLKLFDGISQSIMEALCAEVFVVASDIKNHAMILSHQKNAYLINDFSELREAFLYCLMHKFKKIESPMLNANSQKQYYLQILKENFDV
ncbi:glycosyltransferase [Helicobacter colisuis]|uniref:Glycosyltransferase n=1 Tax=Helicobacter colisuis TaxID=2949739 RepID=A0ABT0TUL4_9HELI|nr:glycosyltransferase [Helicobacter colisuis]MCL9819148.1 glycosyltransferase [Helicobacter colisuis]